MKFEMVSTTITGTNGDSNGVVNIYIAKNRESKCFIFEKYLIFILTRKHPTD